MECVALIGSEAPPQATEPVARVNGARIATTSTLLAILRNGSADRYDVFHLIEESAAPDAYAAQLADLGVDTSRVRIVPLAKVRQAVATTPYLALHDGSGPDLARLAAMVRPIAPEATPCTCRCHSLSYSNLVPGLLAGCLGGMVEDSDAVFCGSSDVATALQNLIEHLCTVHGLPLESRRHRIEQVPLGIDVASFAPSVPAPAARSLLGLPGSGRYVTYLGRLSPFDKADLDVLLRAFAALSRMEGNEDLHLLLAGDDTQRYSGYLGARAQALGIARAVHVVPNVSETGKRLALWAADVFVSPADSVQESFGLTVIEAMAAGLPVVASDWGGYRDLVRDGSSGFLVPTAWGPCTSTVETQAELGIFMSDHILLGQGVVVDEEALRHRLRRLLDDEQLRRTMGAHAREQAARFDWPVVVARYEELWRELKQRAVETRSPGSSAARPPSRFPFFEVFGHYATHQLAPEDVIELRTDAAGGPPPPVSLQLVVAQDAIQRMLSLLGGGPQPVAALVRQETDLLGLLWLAKGGSVRIKRRAGAGRTPS